MRRNEVEKLAFNALAFCDLRKILRRLGNCAIADHLSSAKRAGQSIDDLGTSLSTRLSDPARRLDRGQFQSTRHMPDDSQLG